jgi:hypothetical protein
VERRLRLGRLIDFLVSAVALSLLLCAFALLLHKLGRLPDDGWRLLGLSVLSLSFVLTATGWLLPVSRAHAAKRLDQAGQLADRCTAAHAFIESGEVERDDYARATLADAALHAPQVKPGHAAPLPWPRDLRLVGLLAVVVAVVGAVRMPSPPPPPAPPRAKTARLLELGASDLLERREELKAFQKDEELAKDPAMRDFADELQKLFDKLEQKQLTRKEAFEKIAALEKKYFEGKDGDFEALKDKIRRMGGMLAKDKVAEDLGRSLQGGDLAKARREIEKLVEKLEQKKLSEPEKKRLARALERAAQKERDPADQRREELKREINKLEREQEKNPNQDRKKRLEREKRELKRLEREQEQKKDPEKERAERQLKRLQRELEEAAQQLMSKLDKQSADALRKAMEQMSRLQDEIRRVGGRQRAQGQLADLKELLRRLKAGGKIRLGQLDDYNNRAGGKRRGQGQGESNDIVLGPPGSGGTRLKLPGMGQGGGQRPTGQGQGSGNDKGGREAGVGHDPNILGASTSINAKRSEKLLDGTQGKGPSRSEVILGASEKGFATRSYRRVYRDYNGVVEDVLKKEKVPLGYKFYVKRYFNLIKPRE